MLEDSSEAGPLVVRSLDLANRVSVVCCVRLESACIIQAQVPSLSFRVDRQVKVVIWVGTGFSSDHPCL